MEILNAKKKSREKCWYFLFSLNKDLFNSVMSPTAIKCWLHEVDFDTSKVRTSKLANPIMMKRKFIYQLEYTILTYINCGCERPSIWNTIFFISCAVGRCSRKEACSLHCRRRSPCPSSILIFSVSNANNSQLVYFQGPSFVSDNYNNRVLYNISIVSIGTDEKFRHKPKIFTSTSRGRVRNIIFNQNDPCRCE